MSRMRSRIAARISRRVARAIDRIKINSVSARTRDGERFWVKRRRRGTFGLVWFANRFFQLANNPVHIWESVAQWQRWEVDCFQMLNGGDGFRAFADGDRTVWATALPGQSLSDHLVAGSITRPMFEAAGRELARAHASRFPNSTSGWSHGDPHLGNLIYEDRSGRARLIDFEVAHLSALPAAERHADDLLVFLQDLVGLVSLDQWLDFSTAFLQAYHNTNLHNLLKQRLVVPSRGAPSIWWTIRTNYLGRGELIRRIEMLRASL